MLPSQRIFIGSFLISTGILSGCAGAGPDLSGPEGPNLMAAYSGDWVLDRAESEDLDSKMRDSARRPSGGMAGGGMAGGRPSGGRGGGGAGGMGRGGGMGSTQMDPEAMRATMEALRGLARTPSELSLTLRPETITLAESAAAITVLTFGAEKEDIIQGGAKILGTARWTAKGIEIKRELEMGGGIKDKFSLSETGTLILRREIELMAGTVKGDLVFNRKPSGL